MCLKKGVKTPDDATISTVLVQPSPTSYLLSDSDSVEEDTVKAVRVKHAGSGSWCVKVDIQGVPVYGPIDTETPDM